MKVELIDGALEAERLALEWLTEQDAPAPRLWAAGTLDDSGEHPGAACLVVDRVAGGPTSSLAGWGRLGRALARLAEVPWEGSGLTTLDHDAFRDLHERRVADLSTALGRDIGASLPPLPQFLRRVPADRSPTATPAPATSSTTGTRGRWSTGRTRSSRRVASTSAAPASSPCSASAPKDGWRKNWRRAPRPSPRASSPRSGAARRGRPPSAKTSKANSTGGSPSPASSSRTGGSSAPRRPASPPGSTPSPSSNPRFPDERLVSEPPPVLAPHQLTTRRVQ